MENSLPKITIASNKLTDIENGLKTEWLVTNGLGGYASSSVLGVNTRKYHGLLVAAFDPPVARHVLLTKLDEEVRFNDETVSLAAGENTQGVQAESLRFLSSFSLEPFPTYTYSVGSQFHLKKTIFMPSGRNASIILYEAFNPTPRKAKVSVTPLINFRSFHTVTQRDQTSWNLVQEDSNSVLIEPSTRLSSLLLFSAEGRYILGSSEWIEAYYRVEAQRGESNVDYNYKQGFFDFDIPPNETKLFSVTAVAGKDQNEVWSVFSSIYKDPTSISALFNAEIKRRTDLLSSFRKLHRGIQSEDWLKWLVLAADSFLVNRESTKARSVIAGYHWFNDWGRDSLMSLPGLTLVTGRFEDAKQILLTFARYCSEGLVPNSFPDSPEKTPAYNTVDATLWFINAVLQFLKYTNEFGFVEENLWSTLQSIVEHHQDGTLFNIHVDEDGLIAHGPQLTWMDAAPGTTPVTPRNGKAVEIQALWYNALKTMQLLANRFGQEEKGDVYRLRSEKAYKSFLRKFWNSEANCLFDVIDGEQRDNSLRPNQILAVSLDFSMLDKTRMEHVLEMVQKQLLTPCGLKTLAASDPRYIGKYAGDRWQRDRAYHNGTVWPWLLGPFITAYLRLRNHEEEWRSQAFAAFLKPLFTTEFFRAGLGSISEVFDGDAPHEPNGCIAQAWSVAELLRAYIEEVLLKRPPYERKVLGLL